MEDLEAPFGVDILAVLRRDCPFVCPLSQCEAFARNGVAGRSARWEGDIVSGHP